MTGSSGVGGGSAAFPPIAVYVHWPYCARICPYCDFNVVRARGREDEAHALVDAIVADLGAHARLTGPRSLVSIFFGGGTPSLLPPEHVARIVEAAGRLWTPSPDIEISLEANPTDAEADRFGALADAGVRRLSLGLQSLDDAALRFLGRNHDAAEAVRAASVAARVFPRLSVDLIYARPGQTAPAWTQELQRAVDLGAEHLSPYQLTIEDGTAFGRAVRRGVFAPPPEDLAAELYDATQSELERHGFDAYEVSNHARGPAARSRHNLAYWRGEDYVGVGPGAHGRITVDGVRQATEGVHRPADYIARVRAAGVGHGAAELLDPVAAAEERLLIGLRISEGVPFADVHALHLRPETPRVRALTELGLLAPDPLRLRATSEGRRVLDRLTTELAIGGED